MRAAVLALLAATAVGIKVADITKCRAGKADLAGDSKVYTVQVCNLFGATCYMNQVETASGDCATKALKIENKQCGLFPIMTYKGNARSDATQLQVGGPGCSTSCNGDDCKYSGGCVSVQCSLGTNSWAGPAMTKDGTRSSRKKAVTDTAATDAFQELNFAEITSNVKGSKTVLLSRTGNFVAIHSRTKTGTAGTAGALPYIAGNNYGPYACPSATQLVSAATLTKDQIRMCGNTGKWVYFGAANLLMDKDTYAKYSGNSATGVATTKKNINSIPFLHGNSNYESGVNMDDSRQIYLHDGAAAAAVVMTSGTITPSTSNHGTGALFDKPTAGQWRFYMVVFYCDKYDRTDLTTCPDANRKMFYVADPDPAPKYGDTVGSLGSGGSPSPTPSGGHRAAASLAALIVLVMGPMFAMS